MSSAPIINTDRLTLRPLNPGDFGPLADFYASDRSRFVGGPMTAEQTWRALASEIGHWSLRGYGRWAVDVSKSSSFAGIVGLWNPHGWPEPELGWDLMNGYEGYGYATEAALAAREYAYKTLGWTTLISLIRNDNEGSVGVANRLDTKYEGQFTHERHGDMQVWRHPSPEALCDGGIEAYA
jgi:RimJ/RimL family protein N-acetyltransferase